jgi:hypothetical protein
VILLLLAIPCVLTRQPGQLKRAAMKTLALSGLCMATVFLSSMLASASPPPSVSPWQWPAMMAWVPIVLFGPVAVYMLDKVET